MVTARIVLENLPADEEWQLALALPSVDDAGEIYWNGRLVGSYGKLPPGPVWYFGLDPLTRGLGLHNPAFVPLGRPQSGVVAIRVWTAPYVGFSFPNHGGLTVTPLLGSEEALASLDSVRWYGWLRASLWQLSIGLLSGVASLLALLAWLRDRRQRILLWLALYTIHPLAQLLIFRIPGLSSFRWGYALTCPFLAIEDISLWYLLLYLLGLRDNPRLVRWTWWMAAIAFVCYFGLGAIRLFNWTTWPDHAFLTLDVGLTTPSLLVEAWGVVLVLFSFSRPLDAARWFLALAAMLPTCPRCSRTGPVSVSAGRTRTSGCCLTCPSFQCWAIGSTRYQFWTHSCLWPSSMPFGAIRPSRHSSRTG